MSMSSDEILDDDLDKTIKYRSDWMRCTLSLKMYQHGFGYACM